MKKHTRRSCVVVGKYLPLLMTLFLVGQFSTSTTSAVSRFETRCGWLSNPTPGNVWLYDRDGEWTIGIQGGHQADGDLPDFKPQQWVETNVHYGYGCACLRVKVNHQTHKVLEIESSTARPLSVCRKDRKLKEPK
jgi:hypothetical protein